MAYFHGINITEISGIAGSTSLTPITPGTPTLLGGLILSGQLRIGVPTSGTISGATIGSLLAMPVPGMTVDSAGRVYAGTPTGAAGTIAQGLIETLAGASNSPNATAVTVLAALPSVSLSADLSLAEGNSGPKLFTYTVTRSATAGATSVAWSFAAGATSAADYTGGALPAGGSVGLADGVATGTFAISVNGDTDVEADELFTVSIAAPSGYALGTKSSATGTILNDDAAPLPTVSLSADLSLPEGNSGPKLFTYTVTRSSSVGAISVPWSFAAGSTGATDYTGGTLPSGGLVGIADGSLSGTFAISANGDATVEPDETFTVSIGAPSGYALGARSSATGTIVNDDSATLIALGVDGLEQAIKDGYGAVYAGAGAAAFDTTTTVTTLAELQTAITAAQGNYAQRWRILCDWNGRTTGSAVTIGAIGTAGWFDAGGALLITAASGKTPAIGAAVQVRGTGRGVHLRGIGLANFYNGSGDPTTQYGLQLVRNGTYIGDPVVRVEDCGIGAGYWGGAEADYITGIQTPPGCSTGQLVVWNSTIDGVRWGMKTPMRRVRVHGTDIKRNIGDAMSFVGHTTGEAYRASIWLTQVTGRKLNDTVANRSNHMDFSQTGSASDTHIGYDVLMLDCVDHAEHSYSGSASGGGTQGSYNDDHLTADNRICIRRTVLAVVSPAALRLHSPAATHRSYVDRSTFTRAGRTPSGFAGDDGPAQDFMTGVLCASNALPAAAEVYLAVTDSVLGTQDTLGGKITYIGCATLDPRIAAIGGANAPETIFVGRDFTRGGPAANSIANKFGYSLPNEDGTQAQFIADIWANYEPKAAFAGKGAPDPRGLTWAAPLPGAAPIISEIATNGWTGLWANGTPPTFAPDTAPQTVTLSRAGFDAAAAPTTVTEELVVTQRVRQAWPNHRSLSAATVAFSDYTYATDIIIGGTNGSLEISPKPIVQWVTPHRAVIGNSIGGTGEAAVELIAFHRNARGNRQVAAVKFLIADGTTTIPVTVAATVVSGRVGDRNAVLVYRLPVTDISALTPGLITVNAEVYPWIGGPASVARSAIDGADARGFSPRYFLKDTGLAAARPYAYVSASGNDSNGVVNTNAATAAATPFLTPLAAINAIHTAYSATTGIDGAIIRIGAGTFALASTAATRTQKLAYLTIERDPTVAKSAAIVTYGTAAWRPRFTGALLSPVTTGCVRFNDLTVQRNGTLTIGGESTSFLEMIFDGSVTFDNAGNNSAYLSSGHAYHYGTSFLNASGTSFLGAGTPEQRILRGISTSAAGSVEAWCIVGSSLKSPSMAFGTRSASGGAVAFNTLLDPPSATVMLEIGSAADVNGYAFVQNVVEYISATTNAVVRVSGDNGTGNNSHIVIHANSFAGAYQAGRWNMMYDEGATPRTSKLMSVVGNIGVAFYTKSDVFRGEVSGNPEGFTIGSPSTRTGNWPYMYGVGCRGNFSQFQSNTPIGGNEAQAFPGLGSKIGTSQTIRNDVLFTTYAGTTVAAGPSYTAGAGGGAYTLQSGSPAKVMVASPVLSHGLAGGVRPSTGDAAGAYA